MTTQTRADEGGRFEGRSLEAGVYEITAEDTSKKYQSATITGISCGAANIRIELALASQVNIIVRNNVGVPIEKYSVHLWDEPMSQSLGVSDEAIHVQGSTVVTVPSARVVIEILATGYNPGRVGPLNPDMSVAQPLEIIMQPATGVHGVISSTRGPIPHARAALYKANLKPTLMGGLPLRMQPFPSYSVEADDNGYFVLPVRYAAQFYIRGSANGFASSDIGPFDLDFSSDKTVQLQLGSGGSLEVQLTAADVRECIGKIVRASREDGHPRTVRAGSDGTARFEGLSEGQWFIDIAQEEFVEGSSFVISVGAPIRNEPCASVAVTNDKITHVDLQLDVRRCILSGQLKIDDHGAEKWSVRLKPDNDGVDIAGSFIGAGQFQVKDVAPGGYRLFLMSGVGDTGAPSVLIDHVELDRGETRWNLQLESSVLEGEVHTLPANDNEVMFHKWTHGSVRLYTAVVPDKDGKFRCSWVPAGMGEIVRLNQDLPLENSKETSLVNVEAKRGEVTHVTVP
jgi:hypothetical protein